MSSKVRPDLPPSRQPPIAQAPPSVVSLPDISRKNDVDGYCLRFDARTIPLDGARGGERASRTSRVHAPCGTICAPSPTAAAASTTAGGGGRAGAGRRGATGGAAGALLSLVSSKKDPSVLSGNFAKGVAEESLGMISQGGEGGDCRRRRSWRRRGGRRGRRGEEALHRKGRRDE